MRKTFMIGAATLVAASLAGCHDGHRDHHADAAKVSASVKADVQQLIADFNAHDAAKAVSHDAPDYVGMFHGMPNVVGPDADRTVTQQQMADPAAKVAVSDESVDVAKAGDMAVYRATYDYAYTDPKTKAPATERGNWLLGYKQQPDGGWKLAWGVVSDSGPAPTAAAPSATPTP
ncbi:MAG: nuclear transport factor 2 family protein [Pseudomonadota bacterium]|nr:nuclear transport factor 2 family protein [Pseudomonadota bacterium]